MKTNKNSTLTTYHFTFFKKCKCVDCNRMFRHQAGWEFLTDDNARHICGFCAPTKNEAIIIALREGAALPRMKYPRAVKPTDYPWSLERGCYQPVVSDLDDLDPPKGSGY